MKAFRGLGFEWLYLMSDIVLSKTCLAQTAKTLQKRSMGHFQLCEKYLSNWQLPWQTSLKVLKSLP